MKPHLFAALVLVPSLLNAEPALKLELIGPAEAVKISQKQMDLAASVPETLKKFEAISQSPDPDLKALQATEEAMAKAQSLKQGITLKLRFTNNGKTPVELPYGPDTGTNHLSVEGPGAVDLPFQGMTTEEFRMPNPTTIAPGDSKEFTITELAYGHRDLSRWLVAKPGAYTATVKFSTRGNGEQIELTSNKVTFEVSTIGLPTLPISR